MNLMNIGSKKRLIYLFLRNPDGTQTIKEVNSYYPHYYQKVIDKNQSNAVAYDGTLLKKIYVAEPKDIRNQANSESYSSDIRYTTSYLVNKVDKIDPISPKYFFLDIEILAKELPDTTIADCPIICVSIYNSATKGTLTWYIKDMPTTGFLAQEKYLLEMVVKYFQTEKPDVVLIWNVKFDYPYLVNRCKHFKIDFAKDISPIHTVRSGEEREIYYPVGLSIVDYMVLFKKVYMREQSYALDTVSQKYLKEVAWGKTDFSQLNDRIKDKNANDVIRMQKLEDIFHLIPYYNEIRCMTIVQWEDLVWNSRIVETLLFKEALKRNIILPNKPLANEEEEVEFQGAYRDLKDSGLYRNCGKADLTSAYPSMIFNFCLDTANIVSEPSENTIEVEGVYFKQNENALLPTIVKNFLKLKNKYKKLKKENPNDDNISTIYDGIKAVTNSLYGVVGNKYFRLFDLRVASAVTYLVRDLLAYTKVKLEQEGISVIYIDTDSVVYNKQDNITDKLNKYIQNWAKEKYHKSSIDLKFEYEGYFESVLFLKKCHYMGRVAGKKHPEIRGIESKRSSSSKFEAYFQETLINKVLDGDTRDTIGKWIDSEKERIKHLPIDEIGFPAKISSKEYKNLPIHKRAHDLSKKLNPDFKPGVGEVFYYIFIKGNNDIIAFTKEEKEHMRFCEIDYDKLIEREINNKTTKIFEALKWSTFNANQISLF
jgi:DNA polymerase elongation subunit (family B)